MRRGGYLVREALMNVRYNRTTTMVAVGTTAFTLACFGIFVLVYLNLKGVTGSLQGDIKVILYLQDGLPPQSVWDLQRRLKNEREADSVVYISKEQALADFRVQFPAEQHLLQGLGENPLPASLVVTVAPAYGAPEAVKRWAERMRAIPGVVQVQYSQEWIERLHSLARYLELGAAVVGGILSAATVAIIASTIRLALYARRDEMEILRLVGAGRLFIRIPYLLEGAVLGAVGGAFSLAMLRAGYEYVFSQGGPSGRGLALGTGWSFFPVQMATLMVLGGLLLGLAGSFVSLIELGRPRL
jgi:cell division transport system permease protein